MIEYALSLVEGIFLLNKKEKKEKKNQHSIHKKHSNEHNRTSFKHKCMIFWSSDFMFFKIKQNRAICLSSLKKREEEESVIFPKYISGYVG